MDYANFCGPTYGSRVQEVAYEHCVNFYPELSENAGARSQWVLIGRPSAMPIANNMWRFPVDSTDPNTAVIRGMRVDSRNSWIWTLVGKNLYVNKSSSGNGVDETIAPMFVSTITTGSNVVDMTDDGRYLAIVDGSNIWVIDMTATTLNQIAMSGMLSNANGVMVAPTHIDTISGLGVVNNTHNDTSIQQPNPTTLCYYSNQYNLSTWYQSYSGVPLDTTAIPFFAAEGAADPVTAIKHLDDMLWLFGPRSFKVYTLSGDFNNPFTRIGGSFTDIGIYAPMSLTLLNDKLFWLGTTIHGGLAVYCTHGYNAERVSTHGIEYMLSTLDASDAYGWQYVIEGHQFYVLSFPASNTTLQWDDQDGCWSECNSIDSTGHQIAWEAKFAASVNSQTYVGIASSNQPFAQICRLSMDQLTEWDGRPIIRYRVGPIIWDMLKRVQHSSLMVDMTVGNGIQDSAQQGADPQVMMYYSDDYGKTWSTLSTRSSGLIGQYTHRVRWNRLGMPVFRIYKLQVSDPVRWQIVGVDIETAGTIRQ